MTKQCLQIARLIAKFRLPFEEPIEVETLSSPSKETLSRFREFAGNEIPRKMIRWLRVSELLRENSTDASLIIATLPYPHRLSNAAEYLSLLDLISNQGPPVVLIRGGGQNVLTFYLE